MKDIERIRAAISLIPPDDRDTWVRMGMAIKSETGDEGFEIWDTWGRQSDSYVERDAKDVWKSCKVNGGITIGTLFHLARQHGWRDNGMRQKPTAEEIAERQRIAAERAAKERAEERDRHEAAAARAVEILAAATGDPAAHPYTITKGVPFGPLARCGLWQQRGWTHALLVPIYGGEGHVWSIQAINGDGDKDFLAGGRIAGGFHPFGKIRGADRVLIGEGLASVAVCVAAKPSPAAAALSASNLKAAALAVREMAPEAEIILVADNDVKPDGGNPGLKAAKEAAAAVGGRVVIPELDGRKCDMWDLWTQRGAEAVQRAIAEWPEPMPIQAVLHPVPAFEPDTLLPEALRGWVMDAAKRMPCPPDFIAAAALAELGSVIGARCAVKPKSRDDWLIVPNLWGADVGDPAAMKSPAISAALKPLDRLTARAREEHAAALGAFEADNVVFEAKEEAIKTRIKAAAKGEKKDGKKGNTEDLDSLAKELLTHRQEAPKEPILRRYTSNDTTVEKLGELLRENPHGLLVHRDELVGLIASWEKEGREGDRQFYLEAWNGNTSFETDRIKRGSIFIPNLCVSIFGGIQPDKLTAYLEQAAHALANDGMLQRFQLLVYPDPVLWGWIDHLPDKDARDRAFAVFDVLAEFDSVVWGASPADAFVKLPHFHFDEAAQEIFIEWSGDHHRRRSGEEHPIIAQHLAKFDKLFPALALILHLVECAGTGQRGRVTKDAALRAAAWCEFLEAHARRCYGLLVDDGLRSAQALADKVRQGKLSDGFTARDVRRNRWRSLTSDKAIQAALDWLEDEGWLRAEQVGGAGPGTGRRTSRYRINPKTIRREVDHDGLA